MGFREAFLKFPSIETKRLNLRQLVPDDAEAYFNVQSDPFVNDGFDNTSPESVDKIRRHILARSKAYKRKQILTWGIAQKKDDVIIGACWFGDFEHQSRTEVSYLLSSNFVRQGFMTEALEAVTSFGFSKMGLHRIQAYIRPNNIASIKTIQKVGFKKEGCLRKYHFSKQRGWIDKLIFSHLCNDFKNIDQKKDK